MFTNGGKMNKAKIRNFQDGESIPCLIKGNESYYQGKLNLIYNVKQPTEIQDNEYNLLVEIKPDQWIVCNSIDFDFI